MSPFVRRAFTLVELLVVIAIVAILIGLVRPLSAARKSATRGGVPDRQASSNWSATRSTHASRSSGPATGRSGCATAVALFQRRPVREVTGNVWSASWP